MARPRLDVFALRKSLGLSQEKFAEKFPVGIRTVQRWESDVDYAAPSPMAVKTMKRMRAEHEAAQTEKGEAAQSPVVGATPTSTSAGPKKRRASTSDAPRTTYGGGILPSSL